MMLLPLCFNQEMSQYDEYCHNCHGCYNCNNYHHYHGCHHCHRFVSLLFLPLPSFKLVLCSVWIHLIALSNENDNWWCRQYHVQMENVDFPKPNLEATTWCFTFWRRLRHLTFCPHNPPVPPPTKHSPDTSCNKTRTLPTPAATPHGNHRCHSLSQLALEACHLMSLTKCDKICSSAEFFTLPWNLWQSFESRLPRVSLLTILLFDRSPCHPFFWLIEMLSISSILTLGKLPSSPSSEHFFGSPRSLVHLSWTLSSICSTTATKNKVGINNNNQYHINNNSSSNKRIIRPSAS